MRELPEAVRAHIETGGSPHAPGLAAVIYAGAADTVMALRMAIAARDGVLLPLLLRQTARPHYPLHRLLLERVLSVNTAAAGGNTSLMTLQA